MYTRNSKRTKRSAGKPKVLDIAYLSGTPTHIRITSSWHVIGTCSGRIKTGKNTFWNAWGILRKISLKKCKRNRKGR